MAKLVKEIHDLISLAIDKGYTQDITDSQIDEVIDNAQMLLYRQLLKQFPRDKRVRNDLLSFEGATNITIGVNGTGSLPTDFEHEIEAWTTVSTVRYPVQFKESGFYRRRVLDKVDPPTASNVFATIYNNGGKTIEAAPAPSTVTLLYFKRPTKPVYATTGPTNGQYIYDATASTDLDWSATMKDILVQKSLEMLGLNLRDGVIIRAGQPAEPKEATL